MNPPHPRPRGPPGMFPRSPAKTLTARAIRAWVRGAPLHVYLVYAVLIASATLALYTALSLATLLHPGFQWRPHVELQKYAMDAASGCERGEWMGTKTDHIRLGIRELPDLRDGNRPWDAFASVMVHGRKGDVAPHVRGSLQNVVGFRAVVPTPMPEGTEWRCRVTRAHREALDSAFSDPGVQHALVFEDDAYLADADRFRRAMQHYLDARLPFYSFLDGTDHIGGRACPVFRYGMTAYAMTRKFYQRVRRSCLGNCNIPIDTCIAENGALRKSQLPIFHHGTLLTSNERGYAKFAALNNISVEEAVVMTYSLPGRRRAPSK